MTAIDINASGSNPCIGEGTAIMQDLRRSDVLAEKLRNASPTALEDQHFRIAQAAADQAKRERQDAAEKEADTIISNLLAKLESAGHEPGTSIDVMETHGDDDAAAVVFNRLMAAARSNGDTPCWYPFRETERNLCAVPRRFIKLRYGRCPNRDADDSSKAHQPGV